MNRGGLFQRRDDIAAEENDLSAIVIPQCVSVSVVVFFNHKPLIVLKNLGSMMINDWSKLIKTNSSHHHHLHP